MTSVSDFKTTHTFDRRREEGQRICKKHPDRIPVIVEMAPKSTLPELDRKKYLVPKDLTVGQFVYTLRKRMKMSPETAVFVFVNNTLPATASLMSQVYKEHKDDDMFLYFMISGESTFGGSTSH